jgi:hypothetical protein
MGVSGFSGNNARTIEPTTANDNEFGVLWYVSALTNHGAFRGIAAVNCPTFNASSQARQLHLHTAT